MKQLLKFIFLNLINCVKSVGDGIVNMLGLQNVANGEMVKNFFLTSYKNLTKNILINLVFFVKFLKENKNKFFLFKLGVLIIINALLLLLFWKIIILDSNIINTNFIINEIHTIINNLLISIGIDIIPNYLKMFIIMFIIIFLNIIAYYINKMIVLVLLTFKAKMCYKSYNDYFSDSVSFEYFGFIKNNIITPSEKLKLLDEFLINKKLSLNLLDNIKEHLAVLDTKEQIITYLNFTYMQLLSERKIALLESQINILENKLEVQTELSTNIINNDYTWHVITCCLVGAVILGGILYGLSLYNVTDKVNNVTDKVNDYTHLVEKLQDNTALNTELVNVLNDNIDLLKRHIKDDLISLDSNFDKQAYLNSEIINKFNYQQNFNMKLTASADLLETAAKSFGLLFDRINILEDVINNLIEQNKDILLNLKMSEEGFSYTDEVKNESIEVKNESIEVNNDININNDTT